MLGLLDFVDPSLKTIPYYNTLQQTFDFPIRKPYFPYENEQFYRKTLIFIEFTREKKRLFSLEEIPFLFNQGSCRKGGLHFLFRATARQ